jgi:predicted transcriptional regulator
VDEGTKMDVIRLQPEDVAPRAKAPAKELAVRKLVIRLLPGLEEHLRAEMRYRGDLQSMIMEAINSVDLESVRLVELASETRMSPTMISLQPKVHTYLKDLAKARNTSMNIMVNTAIAHWLAGKKIIRLA